MVPAKLNLREVNPVSRIDVALYKILERIAPSLEQRAGLRGVWDAVEPQVHDLIVRHVTPIEMPAEMKILLSVLQANWNGGENGTTNADL